MNADGAEGHAAAVDRQVDCDTRTAVIATVQVQVRVDILRRNLRRRFREAETQRIEAAAGRAVAELQVADASHAAGLRLSPRRHQQVGRPARVAHGRRPSGCGPPKAPCSDSARRSNGPSRRTSARCRGNRVVAAAARSRRASRGRRTGRSRRRRRSFGSRRSAGPCTGRWGCDSGRAPAARRARRSPAAAR